MPGGNHLGAVAAPPCLWADFAASDREFYAFFLLSVTGIGNRYVQMGEGHTPQLYHTVIGRIQDCHCRHPHPFVN